MKLYLASAAPANDRKGFMLTIPKRLLSYHHVINNMLNCDDVFNEIKKQIRRKS